MKTNSLPVNSAGSEYYGMVGSCPVQQSRCDGVPGCYQETLLTLPVKVYNFQTAGW